MYVRVQTACRSRATSKATQGAKAKKKSDTEKRASTKKAAAASGEDNSKKKTASIAQCKEEKKCGGAKKAMTAGPKVEASEESIEAYDDNGDQE